MTKTDPFEPEPGARVETITILSELSEDKTLLIVDDDRAFLTRLARAMEGRGFIVTIAQSVTEGLAVIAHQPPAYAVIDMRLADGNGLDVISELKAKRPEARGDHSYRLWQHRHRRDGGETRRFRLSGEARGCRRHLRRADGDASRQGRGAGKSDVGRPRALGAHSAHLRALRPQRFGDGAAAQHAPSNLAAHSRQTRAALDKI